MSHINPTISKDNTCGEHERNAKLLADFAKKHQHFAFGSGQGVGIFPDLNDEDYELERTRQELELFKLERERQELEERHMLRKEIDWLRRERRESLLAGRRMP